MDNKEMLYELSLKYNTLKMYENTLDQMRKNGVSSEESIARIEQEKQAVESELIELLNPKTEVVESGKKSPSIGEGNKFIQAQKKKAEYKRLYDIRKNFFADIKPLGDNKDQVVYRKAEIPEDKKPTFADVQDKISNSQWISHSNFIFEFPKNEINIDSWRVSGFFYRKKEYGHVCSSQKCTGTSGELFVSVNDFADKNEDGTYNILAQTVLNLEKAGKAHVVGNLYAKIISNDGEELYTFCFENCRFICSDSDGFSYETTGLRRVNLNFEYDELHVLAPNEKLAPKELR